MRLRDFDDMRRQIAESGNYGKKTIAVVAAHDREVLETVKMVNEAGIANAILIGNEKSIRNYANKINMDLTDNEIIDVADEKEAAAIGVAKVSEGKADILMKGSIQTADYLRAVLSSDSVKKNAFLHMATVMKIPAINKLVIVMDCGMVLEPTLKEKVKMINNSIKIAKKIGIDKPKVACIGAVETVNVKMQDTVDAAIISKMSDRNQIKDAVVDGPLSLDLAISEYAATHKGFEGLVAGDADVLLMPNLQTGNVFYKSMMYLAKAESASTLMGVDGPVVLTSRADSKETKLNSIMLSLLMADNNR
jgi:phosphate butyryltransferase